MLYPQPSRGPAWKIPARGKLKVKTYMNTRERTLLWASNLWMFGDGLLGPLFAVFTEKIGGSVLDITTAWAIFAIVTGVLTIVVGRVADRIGHEKLLIAGYALNAVFTFAYLLVDSPLMLFIVQAGLGVSLALANPTWAALYDRYSETGKDGFIWGAAYGYADIARGLAAIAGGLIVTYLSFATLFIIMGSLQVIATILQWQILRPLRPNIRDSSTS